MIMLLLGRKIFPEDFDLPLLWGAAAIELVIEMLMASYFVAAANF